MGSKGWIWRLLQAILMIRYLKVEQNKMGFEAFFFFSRIQNISSFFARRSEWYAFLHVVALHMNPCQGQCSKQSYLNIRPSQSHEPAVDSTVHLSAAGGVPHVVPSLGRRGDPLVWLAAELPTPLCRPCGLWFKHRKALNMQRTLQPAGTRPVGFKALIYVKEPRLMALMPDN